jgi:hypothetical protein
MGSLNTPSKTCIEKFTLSLFTSSVLVPAEDVNAAVTSHFPQNHDNDATILFLRGIGIAINVVWVAIGLRPLISQRL